MCRLARTAYFTISILLDGAMRLGRRLTPTRLVNFLRAARIRIVGRHHYRSASLTQRAESRNCRLCGAIDAVHGIVGEPAVTHDARLQRVDYRLLNCAACDCVYLDPLPSKADLQLLYEESTQFSDVTYSAPENARKIVSRYERRFRDLNLFPDDGEILLEVGAGLAWIAHACKKHSPRIRTVAQDVSSECVAMCPWVDDYRVEPIEALPLDMDATLVSMTHVLEHVPDPEATLQEVSQRVRRGGHVYITAPFRPPFWKPKHGLGPWLNYSYHHVPAHISYLSRAWFVSVAARIDMRLVHWDSSQDAHQVFEAVLEKR
jgi:SAM-dependent methyltransferase